MEFIAEIGDAVKESRFTEFDVEQDVRVVTLHDIGVQWGHEESQIIFMDEIGITVTAGLHLDDDQPGVMVNRYKILIPWTNIVSIILLDRESTDYKTHQELKRRIQRFKNS